MRPTDVPAWRVVEVNGRALGRSWFIELLPGLVQPLILAGVFAGLLSGSQDHLSDWIDGPSFSYAQYVVLGIACASASITGAVDTSHLVFVGLRLSDRFATIVSTPVSTLSLAVGHVLWAGLHGAGLAAALLLVLTPVLPAGALVHLLGAAVLAGLTAGALAAVFGLIVVRSSGSPQVLNVLGRVIVPPLMLFSATLFPLSALPQWAERTLSALPVANGTIAMRALYADQWRELALHGGALLVWVGAATALMTWFLDKELRA
jgi:lipooligosaccharide transport system permease protein